MVAVGCRLRPRLRRPWRTLLPLRFRSHILRARDSACGLLNGGSDYGGEFAESEREELACSASSEESGWIVIEQPGDMFAVPDFFKGEVPCEVRDGEGKQALANFFASSVGLVVCIFRALGGWISSAKLTQENISYWLGLERGWQSKRAVA